VLFDQLDSVLKYRYLNVHAVSADTVTEMTPVKHALAAGSGVQAEIEG